MRIAIEKVPEGVRVELVPDSKSKPIVFTIPASQAESFAEVIRGAAKATAFKFTLEL